MRKLFPLFIFLTALLVIVSCIQKQQTAHKAELDSDLQGTINRFGKTTFDSTLISSFFQTYPELARYEDEVNVIYRGYQFHHIWFDENGVIEFANSLYSKVKGIATEGVYNVFPYPEKIEGIFVDDIENSLNETEMEFMITSMFLFYAENVYKGIDDKIAAATEWLLPKKQVSYENLLDTVMQNTGLLTKNDSVLFIQYYKLRDVLKQYRDIQISGGWDTIAIDPKIKAYKPGDTAIAIVQIRERLHKTGDIAESNNSNKFDDELLAAVNNYQKRNGKGETKTITPQLIKLMNVPVSEYIKKIVVNMERWRWISPEIANAREYIFVNIPSYTLILNRDGKRAFESPVVVGKTMSKTVVFSGNMSFVVFSPYWNVPPSILNNEILPGIKKDKNYLAKHNMEWNNGQVRQKPGKNNSLGRVKFIFPNSNNIYLHDTPLKSLFGRDSRASSHGCVRVGKPRDLAIEVLKKDPEWTPEKIDAAMNAGTEKWVTLKSKIPVHIGYFTAWVNELGEIYFYEDIYNRDDQLFEILIGYEETEMAEK
ncbi:MAG TPA: L,D-transpeptidase family protein [Draconibacterium sp.]|nr:L,D-transpeptidase family protein [Draconibacterium sp.]